MKTISIGVAQGAKSMARHWISYSIDRDPRRRRGWQWRWPWDWGRGPRYGRPHVVRIQPTRQRVRSNDGQRRRIWPWLLLLVLLLLFLFLGLLAFLLFDDPDQSGSAEQTSGGNQPVGAAGLVPGGVVPPIDPALALTRADDGSTMVSVPDRPSLRLGDDAKVMDLGDGSCHDQRYVLMTDGKAVPIDDLDQATVDALARSDVPIDTVALSPNVDTDALRTIASRTGGTFTKME